MNLDQLSLLVSFLDINEFEDNSGSVDLFESLGLSVRERRRVLSCWLGNSVFEVSRESNITCWTRNSKYHRRFGPAIDYSGSPAALMWFRNGRRHRKHDKPAIEWNNGDKAWYFDGKLHTCWSNGKLQSFVW